MKYFFGIVLLTIFVFACRNEDITETELEPEPCSELVNGVYIFPTKYPDPSLSNDEKNEYWNIPEEVLSSITTNGLIRSCYNVPNARFIEMSNGYQPGYELMKIKCRGFEELETRAEAPEKLIEYYDTISIPETIDYALFCIEILIAQDSILTKLSDEQKIKLLKLTFDYHPEKRKIWTKGGFLYDGTVVIMCRIMQFDNYEPFLQLLRTNRKYATFTEGYSYSLSFEQADTIIFHSQNYLSELNFSN